MMPGPPAFWWGAPGWRSALLSPFAAAYGAAARRRLDRGERAEAGLPVLCIGNFTVGGGGKTPTALALGRVALDMGLRPGFLSRGHGGTRAGPLLVDPERHHAGEVGDEPMLLASVAPTAIAVDRKLGAALLRHEAGCDLLIMDDGFQSARLSVDYALLVVDAKRGLGNGAVLPAGPLRAPLPAQLRHADALLLVGSAPAGEAAVRGMAGGGRPVLAARLAPRAPERLAGRRVFAFAGIAHPPKFYGTLRALGAEVARRQDFPDHHPFTAAEVANLVGLAEREGLVLVTTRKDAARLGVPGVASPEILSRIAVLDVDLVFTDAAAAPRVIDAAMTAYGRRIAG